jgi:glycerol-3-phosphate acyltransferase PlsY
VWGGFLILVVLTRYVSLGSCYAGASFPFATWFVFQNVGLTLLGILMGGSLVYMHRSNIKRLLTGTESKFSFRKKKS